MKLGKTPAVAPASEWLDRLAAVVGPAHAIRDAAAMEPYVIEPRDRFEGRAALVLRPGSTEEVSRLLAIANEGRIGIVPQSGNTGLVGGQTPSPAGDEVVLSLDRLTRIRDVDALDNTITVEAGITLKAVQDAAAAADRLFPLSLAAEGSCRIGGNLATNAGGIGVIAHGSARALCLGLEVVLADGRVWDGLRRLRKDNTGYDLKDLFVGSEGTLGVITAAVLKLFPQPRARATAWAGVASPRHGLDLLALARERAPGEVTAIELMPRLGLEFTMRHAAIRDPLEAPYDWYVLLDLSSAAEQAVLTEGVEAMLGEALERGIIADAVLAASAAQAAELWRIRETLPELQKREGGSIKHDVSVPVSRIPALIDEASVAVHRLIPDARLLPFGHVGDGNIHFNITQPEGADRTAFLARSEEVGAAVHEVVLGLDGSISAEHGIGRLKRHLMPAIKSPVELGLMRDLKRLLDPNGILNRGKLLPEDMTASLRFRPIGDGDIEEVIALWERCGLTRPWNNAVKDIAFARTEANSDVLVARLDGEVAASVMVGHDGHRGAVYYVSVTPELQGRGFGRQTMAAAEAWLGARGVWKLNLLLRAENARIRGFYEALGYEVEPRLCMARKLTRAE